MAEISTTATITADCSERKPSTIDSSTLPITHGIKTVEEDLLIRKGSSVSMKNHNNGLIMNQQPESNSSEKDKILPGIPPSIDELHRKMNPPSDVLNSCIDSNLESEQNNIREDNNSRVSTPESRFVENEYHIYEEICQTEATANDLALNSESNEDIPRIPLEVLPELPQRSKSVHKSTMIAPPNENTPFRNGCYLLQSHEETIDGSSAVSEPQPGPSRSSRTTVTSKLFNTLKRKHSMGSKAGKGTVLEMIPKPPLTERLISHQGHVLKFLIVDMFNGFLPRLAILSNRVIHTFKDPQKTQSKESIDLQFILSLQNRVKYKFDHEGQISMFCFEVVLAPSKPNQLTNSGNVKTLRQSYIFGVSERSDRNQWMANILQSVTDVFPETCLTEFIRAGWCYMKTSESSSWSGAWILLAKRKLYFYNYQDRQLQLLDLRKAYCIGEIESDESTQNLQTEPGPSLFIDCPPYTMLHFIMASPRETRIWKKLIVCIAHNNESCMHSQQLTANEVPVIIYKCINFIYAHGSMSQGIYRKSGSSSQVNKVLQLFKENAFAVQLTHGEFNEHDVAGALKKFIRDIPGSFFGQYAITISSLTRLDSMEDKISSYKELLSRLPKIEYQTLKKLIGHLSFIASLEKHNKMSISNLAMIWGSTLMANHNQYTEDEQYFFSQHEVEVVTDLIMLFKNLFIISSEQIEKEQQMLQILQKNCAPAEDLSDIVKHSGGLMIWITIECDPETARPTTNEEETQFSVTITPTTTASDICKELASKTPHEWYNLTLYEVIGDGSLIRPVHYSEKALEIVLKWTYWDEADRKTNYLAIRKTTTLNDVFRHTQQALLLSPTTELKFADQQTKTLCCHKVQLIGREIRILKQLDIKKYEEVMSINLATVHAYLGKEAKRNQSSLRWSITLVEHDFKKRTKDAPFIGHILGGTDFTEQILWYASIFHSLHRDDILPSLSTRL